MSDPVEIDVLQCLIFEESIPNLLEDLTYPRRIVLDVLKNLLKKDEVMAYLEDPVTAEKRPTHLVDFDNLEQFYFRATAKGLKRI